jgi:archaemetzincin
LSHWSPEPVSPTTSRLRSIALVPVGQVQRQSIAVLQEQLPLKFTGVSCQAVEIEIKTEKSWNAPSGQHRATSILADLETHAKLLPQDRLLGVTDLDLYAPGMNFIFGEARLPGRVAIVSTCRLKGTTSYGEAELLSVRIVKEAVHELGHTLGLTHCKNPSCVMCFSNSLEDTDRKGEDYCDECSKKLEINK